MVKQPSSRPHRLALLLLAGLCLAAIGGSASRTRAQTAEETVVISLRTPAAVQDKHPRDPGRRAAIESLKQQLLDAFGGQFEIVYRYDGTAAIAVKARGDVVDRIKRNGLVDGVTPNFEVHAALEQSAVLINAVEPRDTWGVTGDGLVVAVLDTGIDTDHPDLSDDILYEQCFSAAPNLTCPGNTATASGPGAAEDAHGHGTNVSGIITGNGTTSPEGIAPDAKIAAYRVLGPNGSGAYVDILAGLTDVLMNHPEVDLINMSLGDGMNWPAACDSADPTGANNINDLRNAGVLTFAASGNNGYTAGINWPSCLSNVVSTGAVWDETLATVSFLDCTQTPAPADAVTCFSNSSNDLDLLAPGAFITATGMGGGASTYGGTSQASPTAAAVAALALDANPALTPAQLELLLEGTGDLILDSRNALTRPRVDAAAAVLGAPDDDNDGLLAYADNCPTVNNPAQQNTDKDVRPNGPFLTGDDATWPMSDTAGDYCDADDDNDGINDVDEATGAACFNTPTDPLLVDHDGDHLTDGWECAHIDEPFIPGADDAVDPARKFIGTGSADADGDHVLDLWENRGYNASASAMDSDADGCADLVETASVDGNKTVADPDRLATARRALGIWPANAEHDLVLDIDRNGVVGDPDRLFVARAALLAGWQPKTCP